MKVAILGASDKPDRFAYKAFKLLKNYYHEPIPVSPKVKEIEGTPVVTELKDISTPVDTLTMYVNPRISSQIKDDIIKLKPRRIIFNPGSENPEIESELKAAGIEVVRDCTLVMLNGKYF